MSTPFGSHFKRKGKYLGYDLHITRREDWSDTDSDISAEEWLRYVESDPELRICFEQGQYFAVWCASLHDSWLDWSDGQIYSKNPDSPLINKMIKIAQQLGANVQGDDGELYDETES